MRSIRIVQAVYSGKHGWATVESMVVFSGARLSARVASTLLCPILDLLEPVSPGPTTLSRHSIQPEAEACSPSVLTTESGCGTHRRPVAVIAIRAVRHKRHR